MNTSEIIAVIAISASTLISSISLLISYFINKSNILARRSDIAFENRLEAFREMMEKAKHFEYVISDYVNIGLKSKGRVDIYKSNCLRALEEFVFTYWKQNVYFPPAVDTAVGDLRKLSIDYLNKLDVKYDESIAKEWFSRYAERQNQISALMQEVIGIK